MFNKNIQQYFMILKHIVTETNIKFHYQTNIVAKLEYCQCFIKSIINIMQQHLLTINKIITQILLFKNYKLNLMHRSILKLINITQILKSQLHLLLNYKDFQECKYIVRASILTQPPKLMIFVDMIYHLFLEN